MCRQTAGCNAGTAGARGHRAWCNRPAEHFKHFKGLKLANGRLERPKNRGYVQANGRLQRWNSRGSRPQGLVQRPAEQFKHLKGAMQARLTATGLGGSLGQCQGQTATGLGGSLGQCEGHGRDKAGSTPPVVPGAAPALAKAGVGG